MKKIVLLVIFLLFSFSNKTYAQDKKYDIDFHSKYNISLEGKTTVNQKITIKNHTQYYYISSYNISPGIEELNNVKAYDNDGAIPIEIIKEEGQVSIKLSFLKKIVGTGKINEFNLSYETNSIAKKLGSIWEIAIPGISKLDDISNYDVFITTPDVFGTPSLMKPEKKIEITNNGFHFSKKDIGNSGVYMVFGNRQLYDFDLDYHISNPNLFPIKTEISLPPNTNYQDILIKNIDPNPIDVKTDSDGNWLAIYELLPKKNLDIKVLGTAAIYTNPRKEKLRESNRSLYLKEKKYWEIEDKEIKQAAKNLKTPFDVYNFVVQKLKYDYQKLDTDNERYGAKKTLTNPSKSVCLEFTDLFVALSRTIGIPARAVEGYAYTQNHKEKPLSLLKDILHAWPEYYDDKKETWIMVDPTWGNTTNGIDFFNNLDTEHFTFVIKGSDSDYPIPAGGYKNGSNTKDVNVKFSDEQNFNLIQKAEISDNIMNFYISGIPINSSITIKNIGNSLIENKNFEVYLDAVNNKQIIQVGSIPPYGKKTYNISFDRTPILTNGEYEFKIQLGTNIITKKVKIGIVPEKMILPIGGGAVASIILIFFITRKVRHILIQKHKE